ncbi:MAG TPA: hypothetical protein VK982_14630, partial [Bacteroidales bacterium]|nr:hypothetical protein [Bacteroidales bacterium]
AMAEANNTLQESTGLLVAGYDITRNAEITSRALRTVSMRIRGLEEDGSKIEGLIPKLEGQFNDLGLTLKKDDKTFKSTYEIFKDLSTVWDKMSDFKRAKLLEDIASKRNSQVVAAIIKNMDKAVKVSNDFEKSQGSAMIEHEKYMNSVASAYNRLKETLTELNMKLLKSQTIIKTLDLVTKGLENIEVLGKLSLAFTTATIAIGIFVIQNRKAIKSMETFNVVSSVGGFKKLISDIGLAIKSLLGFKVSADKATISATALNIATGALLLGIPLLAQGIGHLINKQKRMKEANEEVIASFNQNIEKHSNNIKTLKQLEEEYDNLNEKLGENKDFTKLTADEQERYNSLVSQIKQIAPEVVQGYDDKGRAIVAYKTKIEDLIEKEKELIDLENQKMISSGLDIMETTEKEIEKLEKKLDPIINDIESKQNIIKLKEEKYIGNSKYKDNKNVQETQKQDVIKLRAEIAKLQADYDITTGKIKEQKDKQNELMQAHYNTLDILGNVPDKLKEITKSYVDATFAEKGYYAAIGQFETFKSIFDSLDKAFHSSSRGEAEHYLSKVNDGLSTLNFTVEESDKFINDYISSVREVNKEIDDATEQTSNYEQELTSLNQQLEESKKLTDDNLDSIQDLGSAYEKLAKGENLSAEALLNLIQKYPEVAKYISQTNDLTLDRVFDAGGNDLPSYEITVEVAL